MTREELIAYDKWLTGNKWGSSEIITPEQAADLYLAEHPSPPAEGATDKFRDVLNEVQRYIETNGGATESEMKAIWNSLSCAITESEKRQPIAEGAKTEEACGTCKWQYAKFEYKCEDCRAGKNNYEPDQPTADGAEEIIDDAETILHSHPYLKVWTETLFDSEMKVCSIEQALWAIEKAATLHARQIADKMVEERLREELIKYDKYIGSRGWIDNYEDWAAITSVDEYLKSREDSK